MKEPEQLRPTKKSPRIEQMLQNVFQVNRHEVLAGRRCVFCSSPDLNFKDEVSKKEYRISGICQKCQDKQFKKNSDDTYDDDGVNTKNTFNTPTDNE